MKKLMVVFMVLLAVGGLVLANGLQPILSTDSPSKNATPNVKEEMQSLVERIQAAKALNLTPDAALYARLDQLMNESGYSALDCPTHNEGQSVTKQGAGVCDSATIVSSLPYSDTGQTDLIDNCTGAPFNDVFYVWTVPNTADYLIDMCGSSGDSYLRVWLDGVCCSGNSITEDDSCGNNSLDPRMHISLIAGQTVYLECGLYSASDRRRAYVLHISEIIPPPLNDICGGAVPLTIPSETFGSTSNATVDQAPSCGEAATPSARGVWYSVVGDGRMLTATTCSDRTTYDTKISVYMGNCDGLICIDGNDDDANCAAYRSTVTWCGAPGLMYYILVHGYQTASGNFLLGLTAGEACGVLDCESMPLCGEPAELEFNNNCPPPETQTVLSCNGSVYGKICMAVAADHDFWKVVVPPYTILYVAQFDGENCAANPTTCVQSKVYYENCTLAANNASTTGWTATNGSADPFVFYIDVYGIGSCMGGYKLTATCCETMDYCANPIVIPGVTHYESTVNTCCATNPIASVFATGCAGTIYGSGNDAIYLMNLSQTTTMTITATGGDAQIMVFTDCSNAAGTCVASADMLSGTIETISDLVLPAGVYYVSISMYSPAGSNACGQMTLTIDSDHQLPVELTSFTATGGDGSVNLNWSTASETNNDRFELVRDNRVVATLGSQGNGATVHHYNWIETGLHNGQVYHYSLYNVDLNGTRRMLGTAEASPSQTAQVAEYALYQNYPNPFNPTTQISFDLLEPGFVSLKVYNLMGQLVADLVNSSMASGHHSVTLDASRLPSGVYLYRMTANSFSSEKKMLLLK